MTQEKLNNTSGLNDINAGLPNESDLSNKAKEQDVIGNKETGKETNADTGKIGGSDIKTPNYIQPTSGEVGGEASYKLLPGNYRVTAFPKDGFLFKKWSGPIESGKPGENGSNYIDIDIKNNSSTQLQCSFSECLYTFEIGEREKPLYLNLTDDGMKGIEPKGVTASLKQVKDGQPILINKTHNAKYNEQYTLVLNFNESEYEFVSWEEKNLTFNKNEKGDINTLIVINNKLGFIKPHENVQIFLTAQVRKKLGPIVQSGNLNTTVENKTGGDIKVSSQNNI